MVHAHKLFALIVAAWNWLAQLKQVCNSVRGANGILLEMMLN